MKAGLIYARRLGWRVVPLHSVTPDGSCTCGHVTQPEGGCACGDAKCKRVHDPGSIAKHPRLKSWVEEATSDPAEIEQWIALWPDANVGAVTGTASGFFVLDVDPRHGGNESLADLIDAHGELPETAHAQTPSGGSHYLFKMPGFPVTNSAGKVGPGLDG